MSKIITPEFEKRLERYPLGSQQGRGEDSVVIARLCDNDLKRILLLLEYDPESKKASCFVLAKDYADMKNLLTWHIGWITDPETDEYVDIADLENTGGFRVDSSFTPVSLARYLKEKKLLPHVHRNDIVVLPETELLEASGIPVINQSERMRYVLRVELDIPCSEPEYFFKKRLFLE